MPLGPVMVDLAGLELDAQERERLLHPMVGGVILFKRNYDNPTQLAALCSEIHALRSPHLLIGVDQEGGRVQRFREGFTPIPAMGAIGEIWDSQPQRARRVARDTGYILGAELRAVGVDFSFAPVLDLDYGTSGVIGNRAFHRNAQAVSELAHALALGLQEAGMNAVGKHFPGHGHVAADSHLTVPVDERGLRDLEFADLLPFRQLIDLGLAGIMPAHVIYPRVDERPAGFSRRWLSDILRGQLGFEGVVFSDDLTMEGASVAGGIHERAQAALQAGCDMVLVCNRPDLVDQLLARLHHPLPAMSLIRLARMHGRPHPPSRTDLHESKRYVAALRQLDGVGQADASLAFHDPTNTCGKSG
ncbi:MAG TPA: beta-N-acetylhexosaminidase [Thiobacillaceae bacterium]|nr:beta-N-acetylhexosaminidase [Thiobacillaceae bacterium]HNU64338.1 beta-N-acetylhexosaminidase [Thiobacillaceae bacterium]